MNDQLEIPEHIQRGASVIELFFKSHGIKEWALMGIQSRRSEQKETQNKRLECGGELWMDEASVLVKEEGELKSCPFCGSPAESEQDYNEDGPEERIAFCSNRKCIARDASGTVEQWNKRAPFTDATGKVLLTKERQVGGAFYNGIEWFGAWLVDHAEGETIAEELVQRWAVEACRKHLSMSADAKGAKL